MEIPKNLRGIGIPFYSEAEWHKAKALMEDGHTFHATYAQFVQRVAQQQAQLAGQHQASVRVNINVDAFIGWCRASNRQVNAKSRAEYASWRAAYDDRSGAPKVP